MVFGPRTAATASPDDSLSDFVETQGNVLSKAELFVLPKMLLIISGNFPF